jgi:hypothetical protein
MLASRSVIQKTLEGSSAFMKMRAVSKVTSWMNPMALIVHPNPTEGNSVLTILGKISPPVALPHAAIHYGIANP